MRRQSTARSRSRVKSDAIIRESSDDDDNMANHDLLGKTVKEQYRHGVADHGVVRGRTPVTDLGPARKRPRLDVPEPSLYSNEMALTSELVYARLRVHIRELRSEHHRLTRTSLFQSRQSYARRFVDQDRDKRNGADAKVFKQHLESPFKASTSVPPVQVSGKSRVACEAVEGGKKIKGPVLTVDATCITWTDAVDEVPHYTHYSSLRSNIVAYNQKQLHNYPYFGEKATDDIYEEMQADFDCDVDDRSGKLTQNAHAWHIRGFVLAFLQDIGSCDSHVLYYLLAPINDRELGHIYRTRARSCIEDFDRNSSRWQKVFARLPHKPNEQQLVIASQACDAYLELTGESLWQVVRKSSLADLNTPESIAPLPQLLHKIACRVCHMHDCLHHGDLDELASDDEDLDSDEHPISRVDALDSDWPPIVNHKGHFSADKAAVNDHQEHTREQTTAAYHKLRKELCESDSWQRQRYRPCSHEGFTCEVAQCTCFDSGGLCEKACGCAPSCLRRFRGCRCRRDRRRICYRDDRCECFSLGRECDADLCGSCGADVALDPANRHLQPGLPACCRNVALQLGIPRRTLLGRSEIHGFGLYAGQDIRKHEFVGEYKGELVLHNECERRGTIYGIHKVSYLFMVSEDQNVDAFYTGNKMRFINHASEGSQKGSSNVQAGVYLCNMTPRIGLYASRDITTGEEFLFNYGTKYHQSLVSGETLHDTDNIVPATTRVQSAIDQFVGIDDLKYQHRGMYNGANSGYASSEEKSLSRAISRAESATDGKYIESADPPKSGIYTAVKSATTSISGGMPIRRDDSSREEEGLTADIERQTVRGASSGSDSSSDDSHTSRSMGEEQRMERTVRDEEEDDDFDATRISSSSSSGSGAESSNGHDSDRDFSIDVPRRSTSRASRSRLPTR